MKAQELFTLTSTQQIRPTEWVQVRNSEISMNLGAVLDGPNRKAVMSARMPNSFQSKGGNLLS